MEELQEISRIDIDANAAIPLRLARYLRDVRTPDRFLCGGLTVNLQYGAGSLQDSIQKLVRQDS